MEIREKLNSNQYEILLATQDASIRDVLADCGRKFGKTYVSTRALRDWTVNWRAGLYLVGAPSFPYLRDNYVPELRRCYPDSLLKGGSWEKAFNRSDFTLQVRTPKGDSTILLRSMDGHAADTVRPLSVDALVAEEFGLWPRYAWEYCVRPTLMAKRAKFFAIFTPNGCNHAYEEFTSQADDKRTFKYSSYDGIVPKDEIDRLAAGLPDNVYRQEILAEFLDELGGVFRGLSEIFIGDWEEPIPGEAYVAGVDLARTVDFNTIYIARRSTRQIVYHNRFNNLDWTTQKAIIADALKKYNNAYCYLDSTGIGDPIYQDLTTAGCRIFSYKFTNESKRQLVENLIIMIQNKMITCPDEPTTRHELNIYQAENLPSGNIRYGAPEGYHDDCVVGFMLCAMGLGQSITYPENIADTIQEQRHFAGDRVFG
jgi:hypothetical protein